MALASTGVAFRPVPAGGERPPVARHAPAVANAPSPRAQQRPPQPMPVEIRLAAERASPGGRLELRVTSRSEASHAVDPCSRLIERYVAGAWGVVDEPKHVCGDEVLVLGPGTTRTAAVTLPASLIGGRYRVMLQITRQGPPSTSRLRIISPPFRVVP